MGRPRKHAAPGEGTAEVLATEWDRRAAQVASGALALVSLHAMTSGRVHLAGSGDLRPPVPRPGSLDAAALPSRMGQRLRWPDGRITEIDHAPQRPAPRLAPPIEPGEISPEQPRPAPQPAARSPQPASLPWLKRGNWPFSTT